MTDEKPMIVSLTAKVRCICGEEYDFETEDLMPFGVMTSLNCEDCGRTITVDAEVFAQYEADRA